VKLEHYQPDGTYAIEEVSTCDDAALLVVDRVESA
jgi:hypothetical protein